MKKIKFKIEYVPLSDAQIERHKDFDGLMAAFAAHPKPSFKERLKTKLFGNKFFVYMSGIITGAIISSMIWWGVNQFQTSQQMVKSESTPIEKQSAPSVAGNEKIIAQPEVGQRGIIDEKSSSSTSSTGTIEESKEKNASAQIANESSAVNSASAEKNNSVKNNSKDSNSKSNAEYAKAGSAVGVVSKKSGSKKSASKDASSSTADKNQTIQQKNSASSETTDQTNNSNDATKSDSSGVDGSLAANSFESDTLSKKQENLGASVEEPSPSLIGDSSKKKFQLDLPKIDLGAEWLTTKNAVSKFSDTVGTKTSGFFSKLFGGDSTKKSVAASAALATEPGQSSETTPVADTFKHRFAQVSFVTPLASDGVNGKDYEHNLSLNILQGYNGALNGAEFGGLANVEKGYMKGAQFGGLVNYVFGDVSGAQFGGLVNTGNNLNGFQAGGIVNVAKGTMNGMQAGGIVNIAGDTMNGLQLGGILNVSISDKPSGESWQVAGISNVALGKTSGAQISGIYNGAIDHHGFQIGLINFSKKISGFQLGLINIADSIDGESVGLINIYRNGIHTVDVFGSEVLFASAGLKLGSPHVYSVLAYGVRPYKDLTRMGFGVGIGGHIPFDKGFVNIDGVCWEIHNSGFNDWSSVNLWNQIRFMGGYKITKGISVYAGPTLNLQVYDLSHPAIAPYTIYQHTSGTTQLDGWIGGVIGIQFF